MKKEKTSKKMAVAIANAKRTLHGIDFDKFWDKVMATVGPKHDANERVRSKSLAKLRRSRRVLYQT